MTNNPYEPLHSLKRRLKKLGIEIEYAGNIPYLYLHKINGVTVKERFYAEHGWCIAFYGVKGKVSFNDLRETFKLIRSYVKCPK